MTISGFARRNGVSRQAIEQAIARGLIEVYFETVNGIERTRIDPDTSKNRAYCDNANIGRRLAHKPLQLSASKMQESTEVTENVLDGALIDPETIDDLPARYTLANVRLKEQQAEEKALKNAVRRGELLERDKVDFLFLHLDKLHSNIERMADAFLSDVSMEIIDARRLTSETRARWKDEAFRQISDAKEWIKSEIRNIENSQKQL